MEAGETAASARAVEYLEGRLDSFDDPYTMAIAAYALELGGSPRADEAYERLMEMAEEDEDGLHWPGPSIEPRPMEGRGILPMPERSSAAVETTAYATLALLEHGDVLSASRAARWLSSRRNAYGGYGSTQDTVVALQALTRLIPPGVSLVCLHQTVEGLSLEPTGGGHAIDLKQPPSPELTKDLSRYTITVTHRLVVGYFLAQDVPEGWREHPLLHNHRVAVFADGVCTLTGTLYILRLNRELGLEIEKEAK